MTGGAKLYFAGVPRDPDIRKLMDTFGVPKDGQTITYDEVSACIGVSWRTKRFSGVTWAWRQKLFRDHNLLLKPVPGTAFEVADAPARVDITGKTLKKGMKAVVKSNIVGSRTSRKGLNDEEKHALDHHVRVSSTIMQAHRTAVKDLGPLPSLAPSSTRK